MTAHLLRVNALGPHEGIPQGLSAQGEGRCPFTAVLRDAEFWAAVQHGIDTHGELDDQVCERCGGEGTVFTRHPQTGDEIDLPCPECCGLARRRMEVSA